MPAGHTRLFVRIEDAIGLRDVDTILRASPRVVAAAIGAGNLGAQMGWRDPIALRNAMLAVTAAATAAGVMPLGLATTIEQFNDLDTYQSQVRQARGLGSLGAPCIHPRQIAILNEVFTPSSEEIREAQQLLEEFERHSGAGTGAFMLQGTFVDDAVAQRARRLLQFATIQE